MSLASFRRSAWSLGAIVFGLAACQGNIGSGGLPLQAPQGGFSPNAQAFAPAVTRERDLDGAVYLAPAMTTIPLPPLDGFAVTLALGTPPPGASPSASTSPGASASPSALRERTRDVVVAQVPSPSAAPTPAPALTGAPLAGTSPAPSGAAASPGASTSPAASGTGAASPVVSGSPHARKPGPSPTPSGPKIDLKMVIYPDEAPSLPTPSPTGNVQVFQHRLPIVRAYVMPHAADVDLYGLAAVHISVPKDEAPGGRGFTVAIFEAKKKYKGRMIAFDASPDVSGTSIESTLETPIVLKKNSGYYIVLFGDQLAPTPLPSSAVPQPALPPGYATPAANPYGNYGTPNPYATYNPYASPTPFGAR